MAITNADISGGHTLYGLSTDTKPIEKGVTNGDVFICMDTMEFFFFDAEHKEWVKITV